MKHTGTDKGKKSAGGTSKKREKSAQDSGKIATDFLDDLEKTLDRVAESNPRIDKQEDGEAGRTADLRALLEAALAVNSSLVLDDLLELVMRKAIELMSAERGLIMLLDEDGQLQVKAAYNLCKEEMMDEDFKISGSVTTEVARTGKPVYTSDAMADDRYAQYKSVVELHLRSIMCVPLVVKEKVIGVIYLDNSSQTKMFLKSDLYLFELYAQLVSNALHNANIYESLLRMERFNESVVTSSPVGIIVLDGRGRIVTINTAALEIFEFNRTQINLVGQSDHPSVFIDSLPASEQARWRTMVTTALDTRQEVEDSRFFHNTGYLEKALSVKLCPLSGLPDGSEGLVMTIEDVTEKMTMEQYVILSEKLVAKGEMAASVAHELNNFLSIISNNAELMAMNIDRNKLDKVQHNAQQITDNVQKIKRFVDSLMDFSKPEIEHISYDLRTLIDDVLFSLRIQPRFKLIHFTTQLSDELPNIEMDVGQIQQVIMNLLINAADAIGERATEMQEAGEEYKPEIKIKAFHDEAAEDVVVEIEDNGIGMSPQTRDKIFTLHFSTKKGGHGLGLHNCQKIIELHHGEISVDSEKNVGTTFTITLPRLQPQKEDAKT